MKAEQLLILASVRGIDLGLSRPKREIPLEHRGPPRRRKEHPDDPGIPGVLSAQGRQTRSAREREWSARDLAIAAQGMPDTPWRALCWVVGQEEPSRVYLKGQLLIHAVERKERERWPDTMKRGDCPNCRCNRSQNYVEDLCTLAVAEMARGMTELERGQFFGLADHNWRRHVLRMYQPLYVIAHGWYQDGIRYLQSRLNLRENSTEAA